MSGKSFDIKSQIMGELKLDEFPAPDYQTWRSEVERLLRGAPFEKKMMSATYEGITLQPIYRLDELKKLDFTNNYPGVAPYSRSANELGYSQKPWEIAQKYPYPTPAEFNEALIQDLKRGQTAVSLKLDKAGRRLVDPDQADTGEVGRNGTSLATTGDIARLLEGVELESTPIYIHTGATPLPLAAILFGSLKRRNIDAAKLKVCLKADPLGELAVTGELPIAMDNAIDEIAAVINWADKNQPALKTIAIDSSIYHNAGGSAVEELAFALASGVEYLRQMQNRKLTVDQTAARMVFVFSVGSNFFMELAKLRAARMLWTKVIEACDGSDDSAKMIIHSKTSFYNKTSYDPHVNLLRATTEAFSAILGGCDSLHVGYFDDTLKKPSELSRRISRNIQIILRDESHLDKIIDPAGGSWYIENLTGELMDKAWQLFQEIEKSGGMLKALRDGIPQQRIQSVDSQREKNIAKRKDVFVGTTMYANLTEKPEPRQAPDYEHLRLTRITEMKTYRNSIDEGSKAKALESLAKSDDMLVEKAIEAAASGASLGEIAKSISKDSGERFNIYPLKIHRGAEMFEVLRTSIQNSRNQTGENLDITLACFGKLSDFKAREDFSAGFFQTGGFTTRTLVVKDNDSAIKEILESKSKVVTICSSDDNYPEIVPGFVSALKQANPDIVVILAGYPKDQIEQHKKSGVDEFIYLGANVYETLVQLSQKMGVRS